MAAGRKPGDGAKQNRRRVPRAVDAAALIGVTRQRLNDMRLNAPWWKAEFCVVDEGGWDVCGIAAAQADFHARQDCESPASDSETAQRLAAAQLKEAEATAEIKELEKARRERQEAEAEKSLVRWAVVESLMREALQEQRRLWDDFSWSFSRQVPPEFQPLCYVKELDQCEQLSEAAPLQRAVLKLTEEFERWFARVPDELFETDDDQQPEQGG